MRHPITSRKVALLVTAAESSIRAARAAWGDLDSVQRHLGAAAYRYALADLERHRLRGAIVLNQQPYYMGR